MFIEGEFIIKGDPLCVGDVFIVVSNGRETCTSSCIFVEYGCAAFLQVSFKKLVFLPIDY